MIQPRLEAAIDEETGDLRHGQVLDEVTGQRGSEQRLPVRPSLEAGGQCHILKIELRRLDQPLIQVGKERLQPPQNAIGLED